MSKKESSSVEAKRALVSSVEIPPMHPFASETCSNCSGWVPLQGDQTLGHCIPSRSSQPYAMITMDRQSCGKWDAEKWKPKKIVP